MHYFYYNCHALNSIALYFLNSTVTLSHSLNHALLYYHKLTFTVIPCSRLYPFKPFHHDFCPKHRPLTHFHPPLSSTQPRQKRHFRHSRQRNSRLLPPTSHLVLRCSQGPQNILHQNAHNIPRARSILLSSLRRPSIAHPLSP